MVAYLQGVRQYNEGKTEQNLEIMGNYTKLDRDLLNQSCWMPIAKNGDLTQKTCQGIHGLDVCKQEDHPESD